MWKIFKSAVIGRGHASQGEPCQDKVFSLENRGIKAAALADGAGSASLSQFGAETVVEEVCRLLTERFEEFFREENAARVGQEILSHLHDKLAERAEQLACSLDDLASTLLFVAVSKEHYLLGHLGDGVIGCLKGEDLLVASHPENGEFANETVFVTSSAALQSLRLMKGRLAEIQGFVLMSDGTEAGLYDKRKKELAPVLKKVMGLMSVLPVEEMQRSLQESMEEVIRQKTQDDCSLILCVSARKGFPGYRQHTLREKLRLFGLRRLSASALKRVKVYDRLLHFLQAEHSLQETAAFLHQKSGHARRKLSFLQKLGYVEKTEHGYRTIQIVA